MCLLNIFRRKYSLKKSKVIFFVYYFNYFFRKNFPPYVFMRICIIFFNC